MWKKAISIGAVAALALTAFVLPTSASAATGDHIVAAITGTTDTGSTPPIDVLEPPASRSGTFDDTQIAGDFTAGGNVCAAVVDIGTVDFNTTETLLFGTGNLPGGETFSATCLGTGDALTGELVGGTFERAGTVAVASVDIDFELDGVAASVTMTCEITATPLPPDFASAAVGGACEGIDV